MAPSHSFTSCPGACNFVCLLFARALSQPAEPCWAPSLWLEKSSLFRLQTQLHSQLQVSGLPAWPQVHRLRIRSICHQSVSLSWTKAALEEVLSSPAWTSATLPAGPSVSDSFLYSAVRESYSKRRADLLSPLLESCQWLHATCCSFQCGGQSPPEPRLWPSAQRLQPPLPWAHTPHLSGDPKMLPTLFPGQTPTVLSSRLSVSITFSQ